VTSFTRIVQRHGGNSGCAHLDVREQFRAMAFAQLTWRESLRDIEASAVREFEQVVRNGISLGGQTFDAGRCQRIARLAYLVGSGGRVDPPRTQALRERLAGCRVGQHRLRLDSSTVDLCLSLFDWAPFRSTKAAIKLHTLLDLRAPSLPSSTSATARWAT